MPTTDLHINSNIIEVTKGLDDAVKSTEKLEQNTKDLGTASTKAMNDTQQASMKLSGTLKMMGGLMAGAFSVTALIAWGKTVVSSTDAGADAMDRFKEGTKQTLAELNRSLATLDFTNLIQGLRDAFTEGERYAGVLDEIEDRQRALGVQTLDIESQIIDQKVIARNRALDIKDRQAAIDKIVELETLKLTKTREVTQKALNNELTNAAQISKLREDEVRDLVVNFDKYVDLIDEGTELNKKLNALRVEASTPISGGVSPEGVIITKENTAAIKVYNDAMGALTDTQRENIKFATAFNLISAEQRNLIAKAAGDDISAINSQKNAELELSRLRNSLYAELIGEKEKAAKEEKKLTKSTVEENLESLDKFIEEANKKTFDIELGFGGMQSAEEFQKQIDENLKDFEVTMSITPEFSTDESIEAQAWDAAFEMMQDNLAEFEKIQRETWERMQQFAEDHPFAEAMGFENEEQLEQVKDYVGQLVEFANELIDQQVQATQRIVDDQNQRIEEQQELVNQEFQLKEEGLANNYRVEQENLKKMQIARDAAIKDREKAIRIQRTMSTIEAGVSLVTAAANIMKGFSGIPVVGVILGLAAVAAMIAGFVAAQSKVKEATQLKKGARLSGPSHAEGGMRIEGTDLEVEGKEWFVNAKSSEKYNDLLTAINKDDRKGLQIAVNRHNLIKAFPVNTGVNIDDSKKLSEIVKLMKSGDGVFMGNGFYIEQRGTMRKTIRLN